MNSTIVRALVAPPACAKFNSLISLSKSDVKSVWMLKSRGKESRETLSDSDSISIVPDSTSDDRFDLDIDDNNFLMQNYSQDSFKIPETKAEKMKKLRLVKLDFISIAPASAQPQHIVNLQQSFNFAAPFKSSKVISTQTSKIDLIENSTTEKSDQRRLCRPASLPPENIALVHLERRVQADVKPNTLGRMFGDGDQIISKHDNFELPTPEMRKPDLELADFIPSPAPVHCVMIKSK